MDSFPAFIKIAFTVTVNFLNEQIIIIKIFIKIPIKSLW